MPRDSRVNARERKEERVENGREKERERRERKNRFEHSGRSCVRPGCWRGVSPISRSINVFILYPLPFHLSTGVLRSVRRGGWYAGRGGWFLFRWEKNYGGKVGQKLCPSPFGWVSALIYSRVVKGKKKKGNSTWILERVQIELGLPALSSWISLTFIALVFYSTKNRITTRSDKAGGSFSFGARVSREEKRK